MKQLFYLFLFLGFFSLACLSPAISSGIATPAKTQMAARFEIYQTQTPAAVAMVVTLTSPPRMCVKVIAIDALHLRALPNEKARVIAYLRNGDVVQLQSKVDSDWWLVWLGDLEGFARSVYLESVPCQ